MGIVKYSSTLFGQVIVTLLAGLKFLQTFPAEVRSTISAFNVVASFFLLYSYLALRALLHSTPNHFLYCIFPLLAGIVWMRLLAFQALALAAYFAFGLPAFLDITLQEDVLAVVARFVLVAVDLHVSFDLDIAYVFELLLSKEGADVIHVDRLLALAAWTVQNVFVKAVSKGANVLSDAQPAESAAAVDEPVRVAHRICADIALSLLNLRQLQYLVLYSLKCGDIGNDLNVPGLKNYLVLKMF